ncbi:TetR/AcrR family transcriptional regulator [Rhodococcus aerolatus]
MPTRNVSVDDAILDAVRRCVLAHGVRRTTLAEVAREAGVSRPTVYRRSPDVAALVADVVTREVTALLPAAVGDGDRAGLVAAVLDTVAALRGNELLATILARDPELLATYTSQRLGQSQLAVLEVLTAAVTAAQQSATVRPGDPGRLAAVVLLLAQAAVVSAATVSPVLAPADLDAELRRALDGYLRP